MHWSPPPLEGRLVGARGPAFVGRRDELAHLETIWDEVRRGAGHAVFVGGEPGSGKSRLAAHAAEAMHAAGAVVLVGAGRIDGGLPFIEFVEPLDQLLLHAPAGSLADVLPEEARPLLRLTPHVRRHQPDLPERPFDEHEYRRELFDAVTTTFRRLCADRPVVLLLEDVHWTRTPSRRLLVHLIEQTTSYPLLVLATHRTTAPDRSEDLTFAIADLYRLPGVSRIDLAGLDVDDITEFVAGELAMPSTEARRHATLLRDQTGGNPFFLRELWRELVERGGPDALRSGALHAPATVRDTLAGRLRHLGADQRTVLDRAAVLGQQFALRTLVLASSGDGPAVMDALDRGVRHGLLEPTEDGTGYCFVHALVRQALLDDMPRGLRLAGHLAAARAIERRAGESEHVVPQLAFHYGRAAPLGHADEAVRYAVEAARLAERSFAHEDAASWLEAAATLAGDVDDPAAPGRSQLLLDAADSHLRAGDFGNARRIHEELVAARDGTIRLRAAAGFEDASWRPGLSGDRALALLDRALGSVEFDRTDHHHVRALARKARATAFAGNHQAARRLSTEALDHARALGDELLLADVLEATLMGGPTPDVAATNYQRALELTDLAKQYDLMNRLGAAAAVRRLLAYMGGRPVQWETAQAELRTAARRTGQAFWTWLATSGDHVRAYVTGDFAAASRLADDMQAQAASFGQDDTDGLFGAQVFMVRRETGRLEQVRMVLTGEEDLATTWTPGLLALYVELGLREPAQRMLDSIVRQLHPSQRRTAQWPAVLAYASDAAHWLADVEAARVLRPLVAEYSGYNLVLGHLVTAFGSANRYLGMLDHVLGAPSALEHLEAALEMDTAMGAVVHRAETLVRLADHLATVDPDRASELAQQARALAEPIGQQRVLRLLDEIATDGGGDDGLSARELEVLQLLAEGMSNREIGDELFISQHTAANHVRAILHKTGTSNRTQAAIHAAEVGLLDRDILQ